MSDSHLPLLRDTADRTRALSWGAEWLTPSIQDGTIVDRTVFVCLSVFVLLLGGRAAVLVKTDWIEVQG